MVLDVREELLQNPFDFAQLSNKLISDQFAGAATATAALQRSFCYKKNVKTIWIPKS